MVRNCIIYLHVICFRRFRIYTICPFVYMFSSLIYNSLQQNLRIPYTFACKCNVKTWAVIAESVSDRLRAGWPGDRIPVGARFSAPIHTGPAAHPASYKMDTWSLSRGQSGRGVALTTHPIYHRC
jgi:hypothetical protein